MGGKVSPQVHEKSVPRSAENFDERSPPDSLKVSVTTHHCGQCSFSLNDGRLEFLLGNVAELVRHVVRTGVSKIDPPSPIRGV